MALAPDFLITQRQRLADQLKERHAATRQEALEHIPSGVPVEADVFLQPSQRLRPVPELPGSLPRL